MNKEKIRNCDIPEEIKDICRSCESNIHCQNKGCAFRSLGNEYCDYVENATRKYLDLQKKAELGEHYKHLYSEVKKQKDDVVEYIKSNCILSDEWTELDFCNFVPTGKISYKALKKEKIKDILRMLGKIDE